MQYDLARKTLRQSNCVARNITHKCRSLYKRNVLYLIQQHSLSQLIPCASRTRCKYVTSVIRHSPNAPSPTGHRHRFRRSKLAIDQCTASYNPSLFSWDDTERHQHSQSNIHNLSLHKRLPLSEPAPISPTLAVAAATIHNTIILSEMLLLP
jgi:hypothetical protein